jgi:hypothetical protein
MKSSYFLIALLLIALNQILVNAQSIQPIERNIGKLKISIDPRIEVLSTVQLLSNNTSIKSLFVREDINYSADILSYFESFSLHEAVTITDSLTAKYGFGFDSPITFMLHLTQFPEFEQQSEFSDNLLELSGKGDNLEQYRKSIKEFVQTSDFETFWNNKIPFYNDILDLTISKMGKANFVKNLENYFNETNENYNVILSPSIRGGYGPKITDNEGNEMIYAILPLRNMKRDIPYVKKNALRSWVWHEFGHSFVNPLTDKHSDRVETLSELFEPIKNDMLKLHYAHWDTTLNEHIIRAVNVRLYKKHKNFLISKLWLIAEKQRGFIYTKPIVKKLKEFEKQRDKNNISFSEFYPELLDLFENLIP